MNIPDSRTALNQLRRAERRVRDGQSLLGRLLFETDGQDLIEYALLTTFIGFAGAAAWLAMRNGIAAWYTASNAALYDNWNPPDPVGGGS